MRVKDTGEFGLIERIARLIPASPKVIEGIGDDCAIVRAGNRTLLITCDMAIDGVHFRSSLGTPEEIGWKAAAASLSDIAAMGGAPLFCTIALACPEETEVAFIEDLYKGASGALSRFGAVIVGGDTVRTHEHIAIDVAVVGEVTGQRCLRRKGAQVGDAIAVTGQLGRSAAGLHAIQNGVEAPELRQAHYYPHPRIPEGQWLSGNSSVHAMIDISDGLLQDVGHIAEASDVGVSLQSERLVVAADLQEYCAGRKLDPLDFILAGGEDYELAFAIEAGSCSDVFDAFHREFRTELSVIGEVTGESCELRLDGKEIEPRGFDQFKKTQVLT